MGSGNRSQPWYKHYPSDEMSDAGLRMCSLAARGFWAELKNLMHGAEPRGHLLINGKAPTIRALAGLCSATVEEASACLAELKDNGVYSVTDEGVIYSRRMVRDTEKAKRDAENGGKGGNPRLTPKPSEGVNPHVNHSVNGVPNPRVDRQDKAQRPDARGQKSDPDLEHTEEREPEQRAERASLSLACYSAFEEAHIQVCECPWGGRKSVSRQTRLQLAEIVNSRKDVATFARRFKITAACFLSKAGEGRKFPYDSLTFANFVRHFATFEVDAIGAGRLESLDDAGNVVIYAPLGPPDWRARCKKLGHTRDMNCQSSMQCMVNEQARQRAAQCQGVSA